MKKSVSFFLCICTFISSCDPAIRAEQQQEQPYPFHELEAYILSPSFTTLSGKIITFKFVTDRATFMQAKEIFVRAFVKVYQQLEDLSDERILAINAAFQEEIEYFMCGPGLPFIAIGAFCDEKMIGYVSFDRPNDAGQVYIRELAVDTDCWRERIGSSLVYTSFSLFKDIKSLVLVTRRTNLAARNFYKKLGFHEDESFAHAPWDPKFFIGYVLPT